MIMPCDSRNIAILLLILVGIARNAVFSQVNITTGTYSQNFGTTDVTSWTNNVTYPGWYAVLHTTAVSSTAHVNITAAVPTNTGGFYTYECLGNNDQKIGSRSSATVPGSGRYIRYGLVLRNTTGAAISSVRVQYKGFQLSLAENNGAANTLEFHYTIGSTLPALTVAGTAVPALNFVAPNNHPGPGSTGQVMSYPCTVTQTKTACIPVTLLNNDYILLRWSDRDDANNDPHLALDDVVVDFGVAGSTACNLLLPITLVSFTAEPEGTSVRLNWSTASEFENALFTVERSQYGVEFEHVLDVPGSMFSNELLTYTELDRDPYGGLSYYRLRQTDVDGNFSYSPAVPVLFGGLSDRPLIVFGNSEVFTAVHSFPSGSRYALLDMTGRIIAEGSTTMDGRTELNGSNLSRGAYVVRLVNGDRSESARFVY